MNFNRFFVRDGKNCFYNENFDCYLEITHHSFIRSKERNVRLDSLLQAAELFIKSKKFKSFSDEVICVVLKDKHDAFNNIVVPFGFKTKSRAMYAITVWREFNEDGDSCKFKLGRGQKVLEISMNEFFEANYNFYEFAG